MSSTESRCRVYDPAAIHAMGWAFDKTFEALSETAKQRPNMHMKVALSIIKFFDEGESNPLHLSRMALAINTFSDRDRFGSPATLCSDTIRRQFIADGPIAF